MLAARPSKRTGSDRFANDLRFDIVDGETALGKVIYDRGKLTAAITLGEEAFAVERTVAVDDDRLYQAVARALTGAGKSARDGYELRDGDGRTLAVAQRDKQSFAVARGAESFTFRKGASRPFDLYRLGGDRPLGSVGQRKFWTTTLHMDLPADLEPPFQVFLLVLLLNVTMQRLERLTDLSG
jgi:hypothetical protein